jgi:transposase
MVQEMNPVPRPKGSADLLSDRRRRALALLKSGLSLNEVARRIQCVASSVMRWRNAWRKRGPDALKVGASPGRPLKLKATQRRRLVRLLLKGPLAHGYNTNVWTTARIAEVIRREFGVSYHRAHIGRLMHSLNWSHQKPEKRAVERNEEQIERWKQKEWPRVKKTLHGWVPTSSSPTNPDSC